MLLPPTLEKRPTRAYPEAWRDRLPLVYPSVFGKSFAPFHEELWDWAESITLGNPRSSFLAIWPRGAGKSTSAEVAAVELGAHKRRRYCWYVRETQDQADKSVANINGLLETDNVAAFYPQMSERALLKYGRSKAWRRERLSTANGYTIDGLGLDKAVRGIKDVEQRPDFIVIDDIDSRHDSAVTTQRKFETLTQSVIPAGSPDVVVLFIQNLIIPDGVMAKLVDGRAEALKDRIVSGPHPAMKNLAYKLSGGQYLVTGGEPTWPAGMGRETIQRFINTWGLSAFLREAQHEVDEQEGPYGHVVFQHVDAREVPQLIKIVCWVDPAVTSTDSSNDNAIQIDGLGVDGKIYRLYSWAAVSTPEKTIKQAIRKTIEYGGTKVGVETDQGGDTWKVVYERALQEVREDLIKLGHNDGNTVWPAFDQDKAGAGFGSKGERQNLMLAAYERGEIVHVIGTHTVLERALKRWPKKPLDLSDAAWWAWADITGGRDKRKLAAGAWGR
jgi:hypothetical protein